MSSNLLRLPEDTFNILVATDIHLGYGELDPIRGDDSFVTFEEILKTAAEKKVDFILLGGDLFHDSKPSQRCIHKCVSLLRQYCMGDRPVEVEFLSDQSENFQHCDIPVVNYDDPNLNVSIPVFSIHGNHDDPSGFGRVCSLDLLSAAGLVNYFGKWDDLTQVTLSPLLMRKGSTKLALYGLSHIKDERLARLFRDSKVRFYRPKEFTDLWFNIFVLHQNRVNRGLNKYIPDCLLPEFLDLVIWGHEHECRITCERNETDEFFITQPGSPVATSLCEGEAVEKFIGLLKICGKKFKLEPIKLKTVRPFIFETITLSKCNVDIPDTKPTEEIQRYVAEYVEELINRAKTQETGHPKQPTIPLIRLRVEYREEEHLFNAIRFGLQFQGKIANPQDVVLLRKERLESKGVDIDKKLDREALDDFLKEEDPQALANTRLETVLEKYFQEASSDRNLHILSAKAMAEATTRFVEKDDKEAIQEVFNLQVNKLLAYLEQHDPDENHIDEAIEDFRLDRLVHEEDELNEVRKVLDNESRSQIRRKDGSDSGSNLSDNDFDDFEDKSTTRGKTGRGGRGRGRGRGRGGGGENWGSADSSPPPKPTRGRGSRGGRGASSRARGKKDPLNVSIEQSFRNQSMRNSSTSRRKKGAVFSDSD